MVSRRCSSPQIQVTTRSMPMPKPACGKVPYLRRSRYHRNASSGRLCSWMRRVSSSPSASLSPPPTIFPSRLQHPRDHRADEVLGQDDRVLEVREGHLGLHHPELGQVAPRLGALGAEGRPEAIDLAVGGGGGLVVELAALREVGGALVE